MEEDTRCFVMDTFRPGERDSIEDVILHLKEHQPSRLRLCVVVGLTTEEAMSLADAIPDTIVELRLNHCQHIFVIRVLERLKVSPIKKLYLFGNQINDCIVNGVGELLQANQGLVEVNLKHNAIESIGACTIAQGIRAHSTLERVDLSDSLVDNCGKDALLEAMKLNTTVRFLNLAGKVFRSFPSNQTLGGMLRENKTLETLDLRRNALQPEEAMDMARALRDKNRTLRILRLGSTNLDRPTAMELGAMLSQNTTLKVLDLGGNHKIGFMGAVAIAQGVRTLEHLDLRNTRLGAVGARAVADMITTNETLRSLNLSRNNFGDEGVGYISEALTQNSTLSTLSLSMCAITKAGAVCLGRHLPNMHGIRHLFLYQNPIDEDGSHALIEGIKDNMSIVDLGVEKRFMPSCEELAFYLKLNKIGRRALLEPTVPEGVWSKILRRAQSPEIVFYLLKQKPTLCSHQ